MSIGIHHAATISEIDPAQVTPEVAVTNCQFAKQQLECCSRTAIPRSPLEARAEDWMEETDTIIRTCQNPDIRVAWDRDGHRRNIYGRLAEIERECDDGQRLEPARQPQLDLCVRGRAMAGTAVRLRPSADPGTGPGRLRRTRTVVFHRPGRHYRIPESGMGTR